MGVPAVLGVVMVHGFMSGPEVWDRFTGLIAEDTDLAGAQVLRFGYRTKLWKPWNPTRVIPSLDTVADSLKEFLRTEAERFERLVLAGHSMGGLVIQRHLVRMLADGQGLQLHRIKRVVLLATPSAGSLLGLEARRALLHGNPQERQLRPLNEQVSDTLSRVLKGVINATELSDYTCPIPFSVFAGEEDGVVPRASAQAVFSDAAVLPGTHFTIVQPDSATHRSYTTVKRLLLEASTDSDPPDGTVTILGPAALEVHTATYPDKATSPSVWLTPYLPRDHDRELCDALRPALTGGPSRLVVLIGESSTGKTRALYEALSTLAPHHPLLRPSGAANLLDMLEAGRVRPGTVLWLNEAKRFLYDADGKAAAEQLHALLQRSSGIAAVATLWLEPYWNELTSEQPGAPYAAAKALLTHPALATQISVPHRLFEADLRAWRVLSARRSDPRLREALNAGASDGRVVQHLSGGPELVDAYTAGPGAYYTHQEHALLTAALDARRLGHRAPLTADFLAHAADGVLDARHRAADPQWARALLEGLAAGVRADRTRTDIRNTITPLIAVRSRAGEPARYEPADYLDQHTVHHRADQPGAPSLWEAVTIHPLERDDVVRLAQAAWDRGFRQTAVRLWDRAVRAGHPTLALANLGRELDPDHTGGAISVLYSDPTKTPAVADLLDALHQAGADEAVQALLASDPATQADLGDLPAVAQLVDALHRAGADEATKALGVRAASHTDLTDPSAVAQLVDALQLAGLREAARTLGVRAASHTDVSNPRSVALLVDALYLARLDEAVRTLAVRAASHTDVSKPRTVAQLVKAFHLARLDEAVRTLGPRAARYANLTDPSGVRVLLLSLDRTGLDEAVRTLGVRAARHANLTDPYAVARLLETLREAGVEEAVQTLLALDPASHANPIDLPGVSYLLDELREVRADEAARTLGTRAAHHTDLTDPGAVTHLLDALHQAEADETARTLGARAADHADVTKSSTVAQLLSALCRAGADEAVQALLALDPASHADVTKPRAVADLLDALHQARADEAARALGTRAAHHTDLTETGAVTHLLDALQRNGANEAARTLGTRAATDADVTKPSTVAQLLSALCRAGADEAVQALLALDPASHAD
ncbi:alpha/beta fold hydrolase, partial [Kitasatospora sp. NPDC088548]|uniref:alpha/beta fold hydrolase n=1 Tax=Kitasatospora sp. NPDC088548 TaxID=3364075 RepID=UPI00382E255C